MLRTIAAQGLIGIKQAFKRRPDQECASTARDARRVAVHRRALDPPHLPLPLTNHATKPTTRMARMIGTQIPPSPPIQLPTPHMPPFIMVSPSSSQESGPSEAVRSWQAMSSCDFQSSSVRESEPGMEPAQATPTFDASLFVSEHCTSEMT